MRCRDRRATHRFLGAYRNDVGDNGDRVILLRFAIGHDVLIVRNVDLQLARLTRWLLDGLLAPVPVTSDPKVEIPEPLKPIVELVIEAAQQIIQTGVSNIGAVIGIGAAVIIGAAAYVFHRKSKTCGEDEIDD